MKTILSLKTYIISFHFYRQFLIASLIISVLNFFFLNATESNSILYKIIIGKLFLLVLVFLFYHETQLNQKLTFYKNFGLSKLHLFLNSFLFDVLLTVAIVLIMQAF